MKSGFGLEKFYKIWEEAFVQYDSIRIMMLGDVVGRFGRKIVKEVVPTMKQRCGIHFVTANGENVAGGFGITSKTFYQLKEGGVDIVTMGNHWADKNDVHNLRKIEKTLVIPQNIASVEGVDVIPEFFIPSIKKSVAVVNLLGVYAMKPGNEDPFALLMAKKSILLGKVKSGQVIVICDFHGEATSEKQAVAWFLDGVAAVVAGSHTHTPTADERVSLKGTALLTDMGMSGSYHSVTGMDIRKSMSRLFPPRIKQAQEVAHQDLWLCGLVAEVDPTTCLCKALHRFQYRQKPDFWAVSTAIPQWAEPF